MKSNLKSSSCEPIDSKYFQDYGYIHGKNIFPVLDLSEVCDFIVTSYLEEHASFICDSKIYPHSLDDPFPTETSKLNFAKSNLPSYPHINTPTLIGSPFLKTRISRQILDLFCSFSFINYVSNFFPNSTDFYMHLAPAVRVVYPGNTLAYVPDHIDQGYNSHIVSSHLNYINDKSTYIGSRPYSFLTFWIPLQGCSLTHGGLRLYPGHFIEQSPLSNHFSELWIPSLSSDENKSVVPDYSVGDCLSFHPNILHGSAPNASSNIQKLQKSDSFRVSLDIRIFPETSVTTKHYMSLSTGEKFEPGTGPCSPRL